MQLKSLYIFFALVIIFILYSLNIYFQPSTLSNSNNSTDFSNSKLVWQKYNCQSCHQLYGLGGYLGPDLTNEMSKPNAEKIVKAMLKNGIGIMPAFNLSVDEEAILISFLQEVNKTGNADPRSFKINKNGTIEH